MNDLSVSTFKDDPNPGASLDPILQISAILAQARQDEDLATSLLELGISACLKLGLDPGSRVRETCDELMLFDEIFCPGGETAECALQ